jgi:hypothetical protein
MFTNYNVALNGQRLCTERYEHSNESLNETEQGIKQITLF